MEFLFEFADFWGLPFLTNIIEDHPLYSPKSNTKKSNGQFLFVFDVLVIL